MRKFYFSKTFLFFKSEEKHPKSLWFRNIAVYLHSDIKFKDNGFNA